MRIAIIAPPWLPVPPPAYGGTEAVLDALATGLQAVGHDVLLFATGDSTCQVPTAWTLPCAVGTVRITPATEINHVVHAYAAIQDWSADLVHDHTLVGPLYANRFPAPVVTTNHGPFDGELGPYYRFIGPTVPTVAISHHQASTAQGTAIAAVIHHGIDTAAHQVGAGRGGYALFLGRMTPEKGVHVAARVAAPRVFRSRSQPRDANRPSRPTSTRLSLLCSVAGSSTSGRWPVPRRSNYSAMRCACSIPCSGPSRSAW